MVGSPSPEEQDIVYRDPVAVEPAGERVVPGPGTDVPPDPDEWSLDPDPVRLFRFFALTYNAHRIHYDRDYARDVEGYPGLVVHGLLQALAMAEAARRLLGRDAQRPAAGRLFSFRLPSPLFDNQGMLVGARRGDGQINTRVRDQSGRVTAHGYLTG